MWRCSPMCGATSDPAKAKMSVWYAFVFARRMSVTFTYSRETHYFPFGKIRIVWLHALPWFTLISLLEQVDGYDYNMNSSTMFSWSRFRWGKQSFRRTSWIIWSLRNTLKAGLFTIYLIEWFIRTSLSASIPIRTRIFALSLSVIEQHDIHIRGLFSSACIALNWVPFLVVIWFEYLWSS